MPQLPTEHNQRMSLRIGGEEKSLLMRAASLERANLTEFVTRVALVAAQRVIEQHEQLRLSERETKQVLDLLENPPAPNSKLLRAAQALPKQA